ncbi:MAG: hypothetical protein ACXWC2_14000 [Ramlibacter sp.]
MDATAPSPTALSQAHVRRLRDVYRSAGWPCQDLLEIELLASGLLERVLASSGHESLRVTAAGLALVAAGAQRNRARLSAHEDLVERVAREMGRAGRIAWRGLALRAQVPAGESEGAMQWCICKPDVFSIRNTSVAEYVEPVVHEVKVRRSDLLADLRQAAKRAAYLDLGECWYVLGADARGRCIGDPGEIPDGCGVMVLEQDRLSVARPAARARRHALPFGVWMALARATPAAGLDEECQGLLAANDG